MSPVSSLTNIIKFYIANEILCDFLLCSIVTIVVRRVKSEGKTEDGGWRMEDGGSRMEDGGLRMENGDQREEVGGLRREI